MAKNLTPNQKRCEDCACLVVKNGKWCCDECFGQSVEDVDDCPEGITMEQIEESDKKAKENKVNVGARAETAKKDKKPRTVKISDEKQFVFSEIYNNLCDVFSENVKIEKENKLIIVQFGGKVFKVDLIETRNKKS